MQLAKGHEGRGQVQGGGLANVWSEQRECLQHGASKTGTKARTVAAVAGAGAVAQASADNSAVYSPAIYCLTQFDSPHYAAILQRHGFVLSFP